MKPMPGASFLGRCGLLVRRISRCFRHPVSAILFGVLVPISIFSLVFYPMSFLMGSEGDSWWSSTDKHVLVQKLFLGLSSGTLLSWLAFRRSPHVYCVLLYGCMAVAILLGVFTLPLSALGLNSEHRAPFIYFLVTPWLAAATFGACAEDAMDARNQKAGAATVALGLLPLVGIGIATAVPFAILWSVMFS
ncbi:MAG: hypothetical protein ACI9F9_001506 [Candidatus Paceibacteria bacterium]|jgi:hypothetical protein